MPLPRLHQQLSRRFISAFLLAITVALCHAAPAAPQQIRTSKDADKKATAARADKRSSDSPTNDSKKKDDRAAARKTHPMTDEQQALALKFAREHHRELLPLLNRLRNSRPEEYQRALRDLHSAATRFGRLRERLSEAGYQRQLELWKLDSRIRLQLARWAVTQDEKLKAEIHNLIVARQSLRRDQYTQERDRLTERLKRINELLADPRLTSPEAEWTRLSRSVRPRPAAARKSKSQSKSQSQPAAEKPAKKLRKPDDSTSKSTRKGRSDID